MYNDHRTIFVALVDIRRDLCEQQNVHQLVLYDVPTRHSAINK